MSLVLLEKIILFVAQDPLRPDLGVTKPWLNQSGQECRLRGWTRLRVGAGPACEAGSARPGLSGGRRALTLQMQPRPVLPTESCLFLWEHLFQYWGEGRQAEEQALRVNESNFSCRNVCNKYRVAIKSGNCRCRLWWVRLLQEFSFPAVTVLLYVLFHCTHPFVCLFSVFIDQTCKACGVPGKHCSTLVTGSQVKFVPMGNFQKHGDCICFPPSRALVPNCCSFQMAVALFVFCLSLLLLVNRLYFLEQLQVYRKLRTYPEFPHSQFPLF